MRFLIIFLLSTLQVNASLIPQNDLRIPTNIKKNGMNEQVFNNLIDKVIEPYKEIFLSHYGATKVTVNRKWEDEKVNASAYKRKGEFVVNVYGGLARFSELSQDGLLLILCHEIGHLIGGAPTYKPRNFMSSEGQADYFATAKCFKKITWNDKVHINGSRFHPKAEEECSKHYKNKRELQICLRSSLAQESLAQTLKELAELDTLPNFDTPDSKERTLILFNGYPSAQCRIDTMFAGSLCHRDHNELLDMQLYNKGVCSLSNGDTTGLRPRCWYVDRKDKN